MRRDWRQRILAIGWVVLTCVAVPVDVVTGAPSWMEDAHIDEGLRAFPDDDVVVLLHQRSVEVKSSGDRVAKEHLVIHIRKPPRERAVAYYSHGHAYRKQKDFEGLRVGSTGRSQTFSPVILQGRSGAVVEARTYVVAVDDLTAGDLVGFDLEYTEKSAGAVADRFAPFDEYPVLRMEYEVKIPKGWTGRMVGSTGGTAPELTADVLGDERHTFVLEEIEKAEAIPMQPDLETGFAAEFWDADGLETAASWDEILEWYHGLAESALQDTAGLDAISLELLGDVDGEDVEARLSRAVRDRVRYENVYLGDGGYRPHHALDTWSRAWGDCKDKAILLIGLLRASGRDAYPVLVGTGRRTEPTVRSAGAFNHVIVAVPKDEAPGTSGVADAYRFIDPTAAGVPFGWLPSMDEGARALLVGPSRQQEIFLLPRSLPADNRSEITAKLELHRGDWMSGRIRERHTGQRAFALRRTLAMRSEAEQRKFLADRATARSCVVERVAILGGGVDDDTLIVDYAIKIPEAVNQVQDGLLVWLNPLSARPEPWFPDEERAVPVDFKYPFHSETKVTIAIPDGMSARSVPEPSVFESDVASHVQAVEADSSAIELTSYTEVRAPWVEPADYEALRSWDDAVVTGGRTRIVLSKR